MSKPIRLAMWSGPRNISTAMMRAWENRPDTVVCDEPLYAHYLATTDAPHPGRNDVLAAQSADWRIVVAELCGPVPGGKSIWYQKHMTQHVTGDMPLDWLGGLTNAFLIRDPDEVVASFTQQRPDAALWELGFEAQARLFDYVCEATGAAPPVLDARDVLTDPAGVLRTFCERLGIGFDERMLHWPPGPRTSDGVWAKYWYDAVNRSTGFARYRKPDIRLAAAQQRLADACRPHYERLYRYRIGADAD
ncbi:MAG TPA: HAD family hydrolase [Gammaproteobacteria bacterium]|nr:HAD family hydrolase [Gammaproteobacteria bacterium]